MIRNTFQGMYWRAHETATLTSFERTVPRTPMDPQQNLADLTDHQRITQQIP